MTTVNFDNENGDINLTGVPATFEGGLGVGGMILMKMLMDDGVPTEGIADIMEDYVERMKEVNEQVAEQRAARAALLAAKPEGTA